MSAELINISLNGSLIQATPGQTILQAAAAAGLKVPLMCFSKTLPVEEACRLCIVEVEGLDRPAAACATLVSPGMVVRTDSPRLLAERRAIMQLLLEDHYGDCLPPCNQRCPTNIDIQGYIALIARGQYMEATRLIRQTNPLPLTCGRVCPHPCEAQCRRGRVDQPININHLKRFASDIAYQEPDRLNPPRARSTGRWVALVGGGPAGLSAAYYLALKGHAPVIMEAMPQLGGMLRYGIPEYRLPKAVLDREIAAILSMGVEVRTGTAWTRDFTLQSLLDQGYSAIFLGVGAWINRRMGLPEEDLEGVWPGTVFLNQVALGQVSSLAGQRVAVVGGGNTAMDCARTALRLGAAGVTVYYRRSRKEMPAQAQEVDEAEREGVVFEMCTAPVALCQTEGRLTGLNYQFMELCEMDATGRTQPKPIAGSECQVGLDCLIVAIGQQPDLSLFERDSLASQLILTKRRTVQGEYQTGATNLERIFAGGDLVSGPATVVEAIGAGRRAAEAIDRFLRGRPLEPARHFVFSKGTLHEVDPVNFTGRELIPRAKMPELAVEERAHNFREVEQGLGEAAARAEALRCLSCGCQAAADCRIRQVADLIGMRDFTVKQTPSQPYGLVATHPHIVIDDNKCVVCRTCQRACEHYHGRLAVTVELERAEALTSHRRHRTRFNERCDNCGLCASLCPTGALSYKTAWAKPGPFPLVWGESVCDLCPMACRLRVGKVGGHPVRVEGGGAAPNFGHLCLRGRFELTGLAGWPQRLTTPLVRAGAGLVQAGWDQALATAGEGLARVKKAHGPAALAVLSFGRATLEELYLLGKLARLGLGTNNLDCLDPGASGPGAGRRPDGLVGAPALPPYERIEQQNLVILVGGGLGQAYRLLEPALHRLRAKGGRVILAADAGDSLAGRADLRLDLDPAQVLDHLADALAGRDAQGEAARLVAGARSILILAAEADLAPQGLTAWQHLSSVVASCRGRTVDLGLIPVVPAGRAALEAGLSPAHLPGGLPLSAQGLQAFQEVLGSPPPAEPGLDARQILEEARAGRIKGLVIQAGLNPQVEQAFAWLTEALAGLEFLVVLAGLPEPLCQAAQVVLPRPLCLERAGTYVDGSGLRREVAAAVEPPWGAPSELEALARLLQGQTGRKQPADLAALRAELQALAGAQAGG